MQVHFEKIFEKKFSVKSAAQHASFLSAMDSITFTTREPRATIKSCFAQSEYGMITTLPTQSG